MQKRSAAESIWVLIELLHIAEEVKKVGYCLGSLSIRNIEIHNFRIMRAKKEAPWFRVLDNFLARLHARYLHSDDCKKFGVKISTLKRILKTVAHKNSQRFLLEIFDEALEQSISELPIEKLDIAVLEACISERITFGAPDGQKNRVVSNTDSHPINSDYQMPRSA